MLATKLLGAGTIDKPISVVYRGVINSGTTNLSSHTRTSVNFGEDKQNRYLVFLVTFDGTSYATNSSLTVNGVNATRHIFHNNLSSGDNINSLAIFSIQASGTSGTVVVSNAAAFRLVLGVYSMYSANSNTPVATNSVTANSGSLVLSGTKGGACFAVMGIRRASEERRGVGGFGLTTTTGNQTVSYVNSTGTALSGAVTQNYNAQTDVTGNNNTSVVCAATFK
jgi:hypothetical protein